MKKIVVTLAVIFGLSITQSNAQSISGGIKADANLSNFLLSDMNNVESNMKFGASLGGFMKIDFSETFALQPELLFHYKSSEMKLGGGATDYEYWSAEIPIYAMGQFTAGNGRFYVGIGPYVGLGFSAKYKTGDIDLYEKNDNDESAMNRWDFGGGAIVGYEFGGGIQINASYKIGFLDMMDAGRDNASMNTNTISLGIGYRF
ncbi:hypothetical protein EZS27_036858 [termite gut metagenome]|uniref:Outer membrane protein beta-barrel domain-containing protein n=1 Tax=termite gut metagenome TaxID=433724 RepID=A0A5J4PTW5_9ZZZZ